MDFARAGSVSPGSSTIEPAGAGDLHDGLGCSELVDARANDAFSATDRVGAIGDPSSRLIDFQGEVHAAAEVEAQLDRYAPNGGIAHGAGARVVDTLFDVSWHEREDARDDEGERW